MFRDSGGKTIEKQGEKKKHLSSKVGEKSHQARNSSTTRAGPRNWRRSRLDAYQRIKWAFTGIRKT